MAFLKLNELTFSTLIFIAIALAMDSFAVSISTGSVLKHFHFKAMGKISFLFALFQGIMPVIGWFAGNSFEEYISDYDHWVAFVLLSAIGGKMIYEALWGTDDSPYLDPYSFKKMATLAIATSIDALAVGLSLAVVGITIWTPAVVIGITASLLTVAGMLLGGKVGQIWGKRVEIIGGMVLIGIGIKILVEHLSPV